ncbi:hypothetical protein GEV29_01895 [Aeromicrobium sp. SMF47]|uniref:hypothetical protein n=1 Tax=Aeromicrobium yanjiei TaxID=2662028 RepID=UPI00129E6FAA|nr:hypothetical protein [Aeromicrobium yanjiei]MRJ75281.1 hypothetical protein [Aeromicrobium yanjiei]
MKWMLIGIVVLAVGSALWVRAARQGPGDAQRPHRLDDSMTTRETGEASAPDDPNAAGPQGADAGGTDHT